MNRVTSLVEQASYCDGKVVPIWENGHDAVDLKDTTEEKRKARNQRGSKRNYVHQKNDTTHSSSTSNLKKKRNHNTILPTPLSLPQKEQKKTTVRDEWEETGGPVYLINFRRVVGIEPMPGALCRMSATSQVGQSTPGEKAGPLLGWGQEEWKEKSI
jgi:hypothetical protein